MLGKIDERLAPIEAQRVVFDLGDPAAGIHALSFRLGSFSEVQSSVAISNLEWGLVKVIPEPSTLTLAILFFVCFVCCFRLGRLKST